MYGAADPLLGFRSLFMSDCIERLLPSAHRFLASTSFGKGVAMGVCERIVLSVPPARRSCDLFAPYCLVKTRP